MGATHKSPTLPTAATCMLMLQCMLFTHPLSALQYRATPRQTRQQQSDKHQLALHVNHARLRNFPTHWKLNSSRNYYQAYHVHADQPSGVYSYYIITAYRQPNFRLHFTHCTRQVGSLTSFTKQQLLQCYYSSRQSTLPLQVHSTQHQRRQLKPIHTPH